MTTIDYQKQAAECLRMAQRTPAGEQKALLLSMAQSWQALAEKAQRIEALSTEIDLAAPKDGGPTERNPT
jgi:hypothetical protein